MRTAFERCSFGAMCPDVFVFVDSLPLTANGKVDARLLPAVAISDAPQVTAFREPHTATEIVTSQVWRELLEVRRIGLDDDFFELGGHSLLAVRMLGILGERLGRSVPMSLLVKSSKLGTFAAEIDDSGPFVGEKRVVQLSASPTGQRFWLIHPVGGYVVFARRFASLLEQHLSVYGIQAKGLDGRDAPLTSISDMAREYLALIRAQQPTGPYYIGGFSLGGTVAYEIAQQLIARGEAPAMVAMFDTFAPGFPNNKRPLVWLREKLADARRRGLRSSVRRYSQRFHDQEAQAALRKFGPELQDVIRANRYASRSYKVRPYRGIVTMFRAGDVPDWAGRDFSDLTNGWSKHASHVDVEVIDATHNSLFADPAVQALARRFIERYQRAVDSPRRDGRTDLIERTRRWTSSHYDDVFAGGRQT
jgi:thioesterase domain-containing protein